MKRLILVSLVLGTLSAHASDVSRTIFRIESNSDAQCTRVDSSMSYCFGSRNPVDLSTCKRTEEYDCFSDNGRFSVKLKIKEFYNFDTDRREQKVESVTRF